jgi:hypothetical protein
LALAREGEATDAGGDELLLTAFLSGTAVAPAGSDGMEPAASGGRDAIFQALAARVPEGAAGWTWDKMALLAPALVALAARLVAVRGLRKEADPDHCRPGLGSPR